MTLHCTGNTQLLSALSQPGPEAWEADCLHSATQVLQTENASLHRERPALTPRPAREWGNLKELMTDEQVSTASNAPCSV